MIQDVGYTGKMDRFDQHNYWQSVSALRSPQPEDYLEDCRKLMNLITRAIDARCRQIRDRKRAREEIRSLLTAYVTLSSYSRQAETEKIRTLVDEGKTPVSPQYISVPHYEDELIRNK